jgi:hypothetical protein
VKIALLDFLPEAIIITAGRGYGAGKFLDLFPGAVDFGALIFTLSSLSTAFFGKLSLCGGN